jgi:hypothetical protein
VIDCNQTHIAATRDNFQETLSRTFNELSAQQYAFTEVLGCKDPSSWCMSAVYVVLDILVNHRMLMLGLWWLSTTAMLAAAAWRGVLLRYWQLLRQQLTAASPDAMQYNAMSTAMREEWIASQAAQALNLPPKPRYIEYQPWTPLVPMPFGQSIAEGNEELDDEEEIKVDAPSIGGDEEGGPPHGSRPTPPYPGTPTRRRAHN